MERILIIWSMFLILLGFLIASLQIMTLQNNESQFESMFLQNTKFLFCTEDDNKTVVACFKVNSDFDNFELYSLIEENKTTCFNEKGEQSDCYKELIKD